MRLIVNPHTILIDENSLINEKEINVTTVQFEFATEITNNFVKEAYFTFNGNTYKEIIINNKCNIPYEVLQEKGEVEIGVVAYKVENGTEIKRYNPSSIFINTLYGSLKDKYENIEPITPTDKEQIEQELENFNITIDKDGRTTTIEITDKEGITTSENIYDGEGLDFDWQGTSLGIKKETDSQYEYTDLKGDCNFATFEINNNMELVMNKTEDMLLDFGLDENSYLYVII